MQIKHFLSILYRTLTTLALPPPLNGMLKLVRGLGDKRQIPSSKISSSASLLH
jgi:hypothetical protein